MITDIKRQPYLSLAIAILYQPRPTDSVDINARLQLNDTSSIPPTYGCFFLRSLTYGCIFTLQWRQNGCDGVLNHQRLDCLFNRLFRRRSKKTSKFRVTGLCEGNSPVTSEFPSQRARDAENVAIWWRHHDIYIIIYSYNYNDHYQLNR